MLVLHSQLTEKVKAKKKKQIAVQLEFEFCRYVTC